ncbi:hypothetical protein JCM24511_02213 [Saitozyma sp. JCM 24511]|nr:hypothetical protein JCM24511_02213 [Saitozyma sp. JCM 24511]
MSEYKSNISVDQTQDLPSTQEEGSSGSTTRPGWRQRLSSVRHPFRRRQRQDSTVDEQLSRPSESSLAVEQESESGQGTSSFHHDDEYRKDIAGRVARSKFTINPETRESGAADELLRYAVALHTHTMKSSHPLAIVTLLPIRQTLDSLYGHEDEPGANDTILEQIKLLEGFSG